MKTGYLTPIASALILAIGTVQAYADSGWQYDENSDTVDFSYSGIASTQPRRPSEVVKYSGAWHYVADTETILFTGLESRGGHGNTHPSASALEFDSELSFLDQ